MTARPLDRMTRTQDTGRPTKARAFVKPTLAAVATVAAFVVGAAVPAAARSDNGGDERGTAAAAGGLLVVCGAAWLARRRPKPAARRPGDQGGTAPERDRAPDRGADAPGRGPAADRRHPGEGATPSDGAGSAVPSAARAAVGELQILDLQCCLAAADTRDALARVGSPVRWLARADRSCHDADGYPLLTVRIDALDAAEREVEVDASEETRRALAALDRVLPAALAAARDAAPLAAAVVGLPPESPDADREAAEAWGRRRFGPTGQVVVAEAPTLWRLAAARCAASPGRPVLLAAAGSDLGAGAVERLAAAGRLHGRDAPDGLVPGEGAVALLLRAPIPGAASGATNPARSAAFASLMIPSEDPAAAGARDPDPGPPGAAATGAVGHALASSALTADDLGGWFTDLQPQTPEAADLLSATADLGLRAEPASLAIGACGTLGAVGSLAVVALAAVQAHDGRRPTLALATRPRPMAFVVHPPAARPAAPAGADS